MKRSQISFVVGFFAGILVCFVADSMIGYAHTPCSDDYQPPKCGYVQVINIDGELVQEYVCK